MAATLGGWMSTDLDAGPLRQLSAWLDAARAAGQPMPEAMTLASATSDGVPPARLVVLRGLRRGLVFFTDCQSGKGAELAANPRAAAVLHWLVPAHRQVRVAGPVEPVSQDQADEYWSTRGVKTLQVVSSACRCQEPRDRSVTASATGASSAPACAHVLAKVAGEISAPCRARPFTSEFWLRPAVNRSTRSIAINAFVTVQADARLRERLNWDGSIPWEAFADLWARTADDRDLVPGGGQSARHAAARLQAFLAGLRGLPGPVAAVTHGGVTAELLRNLLGDDALPPGVLAVGIPPCAITTLDDLDPVMIASVSHLR
jgi:broad specificity phosphatase PhoE